MSLLKRKSLEDYLSEVRNPTPQPTKKTAIQQHRCPRCHSTTKPAISFAGSLSTFWRECVNCNTYINTFKPLPHQRAFFEDAHVIKGNFGGFGTGKSITNQQEVMKHLLITPNAHFMVTANVSYQYEQTFKKEFEREIPKDFVLDYSIRNQTMLLINHALLSYRPLDDPRKLRSNNLTGFLIIEASEAKAEGFHELKARTRNTAAKIGDHDWRKGLVESNPDAGYIKDDILLVSDEIQCFGHVFEEYDKMLDPRTKDPLISSHIATTHVNPYLPDNYLEMITRNKPDWWINRYVRSSFIYAEGLVYPRAREAVVPAFTIPDDWPRIVAFDYGLSDNSCFLFGAIDKDGGVVYIYKEAVVNEVNIETLANLFKENTKDIPIGGWYCPPIMDPKTNKRDYNKKDLSTHFREYGIHFKPGQSNIDARVLRLNTYLETGSLKIFNTCSYFINEIVNYKFEERTLDDAKRKVKPKDLDNHAINPAEWIVMELPADPKKLQHGGFDHRGRELTLDEEEYLRTPWQLRDELREESDYGNTSRPYDW